MTLNLSCSLAEKLGTYAVPKKINYKTQSLLELANLNQPPYASNKPPPTSTFS